MHLHTILPILASSCIVIFLIKANTALEISSDLSDRIETSPKASFSKIELEKLIQRTPRAGRQGSRRKKTKHNRNHSIPQDPIRRQDAQQFTGPGLNITSVSPIELSLGGLTGLQGLPPLSIIQFVKLLVAVTPFIIPLIFVPLLIFTVGMFMIPVQKPTLFVGAGGDGPVKRSWNFPSFIVPTLTNVARNFINHEECFERLVCEIGGRYLGNEKEDRAEDKKGGSSIASLNRFDYRNILERVANHFNHPLMRRLSIGIRIPKEVCIEKQCSLISFFQESVHL